MTRAGFTGVAAVALVVTASTLGATKTAAFQAPPQQRSESRPASVTPSTGTVAGTAWKGDTTPYPQATLRLRNAETGRGVARTVSDGNGRFRFENVKPGVYVVELLSNDDKLLAVGDLFGVTAGGQILTLVRLTAKAPWFGGFFGNAASAVIAAASTLGVTANGSSGRPVSPQ